MDKVLVTCWGKNGNMRECQYAIMFMYFNDELVIAQAGFESGDYGKILAGELDNTTPTGFRNQVQITKDNAVGAGFGLNDNRTDRYAESNCNRNLIYGSLVSPNSPYFHADAVGNANFRSLFVDK